MNGSELLNKIDLLIDQGNSVWENPGSKASQDIAKFCGAVKKLVHEFYGDDHPYIKKYAAAGEDIQPDLGEGMSVLKSMRKDVE